MTHRTSVSTRRSFLTLLAGATFALPAAAAPQPAEAFFMPIGDVFPISGIGTVATGKVERGSVRTGDRLDLIGNGTTIAVTVSVMDAAGKPVPAANAGQEIGLVVRGTDAKSVQRGMVLAQPGSVTARKSLTADVTLAAASAGGRSTPINTGYRPLLRIWTGLVPATFTLPGPLAPGATSSVEVELERPSALRIGDSFAITEGGRTIGTGVVKAVKG
jgi:elongation factor Tu